MRVIGNFPHPKCNITFFHWNNRYLIKVESGPLEQTFKVQEYDLSGEEDLKKIVSEEFIDDCMKQFEAMAYSLRKSVEKL
ncbi:MAG TPA: hypothetical protein PKJ63_04445 [Cyclobacteriaceae bacterium]|mgnify:CR=1 FL=1|nr:hypothetical protein [Cyclobacteriaceae bacterium]HRX01262.1 hypothetical protein [Cyclobacteriaceae bacterium]